MSKWAIKKMRMGFQECRKKRNQEEKRKRKRKKKAENPISPEFQLSPPRQSGMLICCSTQNTEAGVLSVSKERLTAIST